MRKSILISLTVLFLFSGSFVYSQPVSDEAMRYFNRGQAAVEMAKSPADYKDAVKEFKKAAALAPNWPDVYYNIGLIQEKIGIYNDAITNLTKYLKLSPNASDAGKVKKFIAKIEYKMEKENRYKTAFAMMAGGDYVRKQIGFKMINGSYEQFRGAPKNVDMGKFRMLFSRQNPWYDRIEAQNPWYEFETKHNSNYVRYRPAITKEWVPVNINGRFYKYEYLFYLDAIGWMGGWYQAQVDYKVKGEIISTNPIRVKETITSSLNKAWPMEGTRRPFGASETATAEYIFEWITDPKFDSPLFRKN